VLAALVLGACASDSGPIEVGGPGRVDEPGPLPTAPSAPPTTSGSSGRPAASSGDVTVDQLVARMDALVAEDDLCTLLTGSALSDVTGADLDLTSLLENPQGFTTLFASLGRLFGHMVDIAPSAAVQSDLETMRGVWQGVAGLDPRAPDAAERAAGLIANPAVQRAQSNLGVWVQSTCVRSS
jgi:hypothetical protein